MHWPSAPTLSPRRRTPHHLHLITHADVKADNVLLVSCPSDPRGYTAVLADLGFVMLMDKVG